MREAISDIAMLITDANLDSDGTRTCTAYMNTSRIYKPAESSPDVCSKSATQSTQLEKPHSHKVMTSG